MSTSLVIGQIVRLITDHSRSGPIIAEIPITGGQMRYRVFHSPTDQISGSTWQIRSNRWISPQPDRLIDALQ